MQNFVYGVRVVHHRNPSSHAGLKPAWLFLFLALLEKLRQNYAISKNGETKTQWPIVLYNLRGHLFLGRKTEKLSQL